MNKITVLFVVSFFYILVTAGEQSARAGENTRPPNSTPTRQATSLNMNVIAYYTQWSVCDMPPQKLDWKGFTHLIYFWGEPSTTAPYFSLYAGSNDSITFEKGTPGWCVNPLDNGSNGQNHQRILRDSAVANGVKLIMCVGGEYGNPASTFSAMIADTSSGGKQDQFIQAALGFAQRHGYSGIDIDWEFPTRGTAGRANYNRFLHKVRQQLDTWSPKGLLTMAVPTWYWWDGQHTDPLIDTATIRQCVNFVDLMEYGMESSSKISHYSPIYPNPALTQETWSLRGIGEWKRAGVQSGQIVPLLPFECIKMKASASPVTLGMSGGSAQWVGIRDVPSGATTHWDDISKVNWADSGTSFYSYENAASIANKVQYARSQNAGGIGVWELWRGWLPNAAAGQHDPLLQALKAAVGNDSSVYVPPTDTVKPVVSISSPANGDSVSGVKSIAVSATDNVGVTRVDFLINGIVAGSSTSVPYSYSWNTTGLSGAQTLSAKAYDAVGNFGVSSAVQVFVKPPAVDTTSPVVTITNPPQSAVLSGSVAVTATVSDKKKITSLQFACDGVNVGSPQSGSSFSQSFNTVQYTDGAHHLTVTAFDSAGYSGSAGVDVVVSNSNPPPVATVSTRDDFDTTVSNTSINGRFKWVNIANQPGSGTIRIVTNTIQPYNSQGVGNFGGVAWDSLMTPGAQIGVTVAQKGGNGTSSSFFLYTRMSNNDLSSGDGYRLQYEDIPSGPDLLSLQRITNGVTSVTLCSVYDEVHVGDTLSLHVLNDSLHTIVAYVNHTPVLGTHDVTYNPVSWYIWLRGCVFTTPVRMDKFLCGFAPNPTDTLPASIFVANGEVLGVKPEKRPYGYELRRNYPNPFNPSTRLQYEIPTQSFVRLTVFNLLGQTVAELVNEEETAGIKSVEWNASGVPSGVYFYRLEATSASDATRKFTSVNKMILMK